MELASMRLHIVKKSFATLWVVVFADASREWNGPEPAR